MRLIEDYKFIDCERSVNSRRYVGFIHDGFVPYARACLSHRTFRPLITGWPSNTSIAMMRHGWVAGQVACRFGGFFRYELYRPWRRYKAVVFLKSMNHASLKLAGWLKTRGVVTVFDANVDYFTPAEGVFYYNGMAPTSEQCEQAWAIAQACDAVIGDSRYITEKAKAFNGHCAWIPDNVRDNDILQGASWQPVAGQKLPLLWSGEAVKLFDLLRIEHVLRLWNKRVRLCLVTSSLAAIDRIYEPWRGRLQRLLEELECEIIPFQSIEHLFSVYDKGGVFISPRFLDNTYNMGHTEWKITLAMARGRVALCSPQPSYEDVAVRSAGKGVRVCRTDDEWDAALGEVLGMSFDWVGEQAAACRVVREHYATSVVAEAHVGFLDALIQEHRSYKS